MDRQRLQVKILLLPNSIVTRPLLTFALEVRIATFFGFISSKNPNPNCFSFFNLFGMLRAGKAIL